MIGSLEHHKCFGCTACVSICPNKAIEMRADEMGFFYPYVKSSCVECGLCDKVCPATHIQNRDPQAGVRAYAARHLEESEIVKSRSGAAFIALSDFVIGKNGVVYGAAFDDSFCVSHQRAENRNGRDTFRGSKYVQSALGDTFSKIKLDLENGRFVLFSGTPCQVAGLRRFIPENLSGRLFLIDILCHGVPAPRVWQDYIEYTRGKYKKDISKVQFRDKSKGWADHVESFEFTDGAKVYSTIFTRLFYSNLIFRDSCYSCPYTSFRREGDISLGDFWGIEKVLPSFNTDDKGVSLILVNNVRGEQWLKSIEYLDCRQVNLDDCMQSALCSPQEDNTDRLLFTQDYYKKGFFYATQKHMNLFPEHKVSYLYWKLVHKINRLIR